MALRDRIGIDVGRRLRLEDAIEWATIHDIHYINIQLASGANALTSFDDARAAGVRRACERHAVHLGLHTRSAVNVAESSPYVSEAVDDYLRAYVDVSSKLGAEWIVVHAGYHFTSDKEMRMKAGLERLKRVVDYAENKNAMVLLENLNKEPADAELHYLAHTTEEWRFYFERIGSPASSSRSRPTARTSFRKGSPALSMRSISPASRRSGSPTASATALKCTSSRAPETSTFPTCSGGSKAKASPAIT
jgi:hypothetical protein